MYLGQLVEYGPTDAIYTPPYHPYTESLLAAIPRAAIEAPESSAIRRFEVVITYIPCLVPPWRTWGRAARTGST